MSLCAWQVQHMTLQRVCVEVTSISHSSWEGHRENRQRLCLPLGGSGIWGTAGGGRACRCAHLGTRTKQGPSRGLSGPHPGLGSWMDSFAGKSASRAVILTVESTQRSPEPSKSSQVMK